MTSTHRKNFIKIFNSITGYRGKFEVWSDFITMFACTISNACDKEHYQKREDLYKQTIKKYNEQEQNLFADLFAELVFAMEENYEQDFLGSVYMELNLCNKKSGQFFTPYDICQLMSEISLGDNLVEQVKKDGYITIHDSCCGAGATLIAAVNESRTILEKENLNFQNHILIAAQDIDYTAALMCYIQLSLLGVAGYVKIGNTITDPITINDSKENYWYTPMYFSNTWVLRRIFRSL